MYEAMRELNKKLDEIIGRQERTLSLVSMQTGGAGALAPGQPPPPPGQIPVGGDTIRRHEVDAMFTNQNQLINAIREVKLVLVFYS